MFAILSSFHNFLCDISGYHGGTPKNIFHGRRQNNLVKIYRCIGGICCLPLNGRRGFCLSYVLSKSRLSSYQTIRSHIPDDDNLVSISGFSILSQFHFFLPTNAFLLLSSCSHFLPFPSSFSFSVQYFFSFLVPCFLYIRISIANLQFLVFFLSPLRRVLILATGLLESLSVRPSVCM